MRETFFCLIILTTSAGIICTMTSPPPRVQQSLDCLVQLILQSYIHTYKHGYSVNSQNKVQSPLRTADDLSNGGTTNCVNTWRLLRYKWAQSYNLVYRWFMLARWLRSTTEKFMNNKIHCQYTFPNSFPKGVSLYQSYCWHLPRHNGSDEIDLCGQY